MNTEDKYELVRLYIRNLSVESPKTGRLPNLINQPSINIDIDPKIVRIAEHQYEVSARFTVSARANGAQLYLIELTQAGFFSISPSGEMHQAELLRRVFPQILYPAARSNLVNFIVVSGYQPIVLDHIRMESLFEKTPIEDKRQPASVATQPEQDKQVEPVAKIPLRESALMKLFKARAAEFIGVGLVVLVAALLIDWKGVVKDFSGKQPEQQVAAKLAVATPSIVSPPLVTGSSSVETPKEVGGWPIEQLGRVGDNWLAAQQAEAFTVELLRTDDLKKIENVAPVAEGQPLFLVKRGGNEYAVLSGRYRSEEQAKQAASNFAGYRVARFSDYR